MLKLVAAKIAPAALMVAVAVVLTALGAPAAASLATVAAVVLFLTA